MKIKIIISLLIAILMINFNCGNDGVLIHNRMSRDINFTISDSNIEKSTIENFDYIKQNDSLFTYHNICYKKSIITYKVDTNFNGNSKELKKYSFEKLRFKSFDITSICEKNKNIQRIEIYDNKLIVY